MVCSSFILCPIIAIDIHFLPTEFLLGETILVAPILEQGKTSRDVYLPEGKWKSSNQSIYGKGWIRDFPAPLGSILYFIKLDTIKSEL